MKELAHQEHLARAFDGAIEPALIMGGQPGVFAGKNAALIGDELLEQIDVLEIKRVDSEIDLGLGTRRAHFRG